MRNFTCVQDLGDLKQALNEAFEIKKDRFQFSELGKNKTLLMIFFNSSLRTRLSTQKAAMNLGMNTIVLDVNQGAWKLETERGVIMKQSLRIKIENLFIYLMFLFSLVLFILSFFHQSSAEIAIRVSTEMGWMVQRTVSLLLLCLYAAKQLLPRQNISFE